MIRNLKTLGLALVAVLAMSAMVASATSAATFTASSGAGVKITFSDTGKIQFTVTNNEIYCEEMTLTGTAPAVSFTSITLNATFNKCFSPWGNATVTGFGQHGEAGKCDFIFYANGTIDLVCPTGQEVTIDAGPCVVHIPAQKGLGTVTDTNNESAGDVNVDLNVQKITQFHTDGFLCPFGGSGHSVEGVLETPLNEPLTATASVGSFTWDT